jgi:hypothetical protein
MPCSDPAFNLSFHDFVVWLGLAPCVYYSECILQLGVIGPDVIGWLILLDNCLHPGRDGGS